MSKTYKRIVRCDNRNRDVEVTFTVSGSWLTPSYKIASCPAMCDSPQSCNRGCSARLTGAPSYVPIHAGRF